MQYYFLIIYFVIATLVSYILNRFFLAKSNNYTLKKANTNAIRWSAQTKPVSGGITFYIIFILSIVAYYLFFSSSLNLYNDITAIFLVVTLSFLMGLADDMLSTSPYFKFFIQILNSIILIKFGIYINIFSNELLNYIITTLWVIGIMNSMNMLDNMDAITSSVSLVIFSFFALLLIDSGNNFLLIILFGIIASLISYLFFNWYPAKMYMGDNGSQLIGSLLAIGGIYLLWNHNIENIAIGKNIILIMFAFTMPIIDTTTVTINRLRKGKSPFIGGRDHTTHHMSYMGLHERQIATIFILLTLLSCSTTYFLYSYPNTWTSLLTILFIFIWLIIFIAIYSTTIFFKQKK